MIPNPEHTVASALYFGHYKLWCTTLYCTPEMIDEVFKDIHHFGRNIVEGYSKVTQSPKTNNLRVSKMELKEFIEC